MSGSSQAERPGTGPVVLALCWGGAVAFTAIVATLVIGPLAAALGCWDSCGDDPIFLRVGRLALEIAGAFALFTATVWLLSAAARRTRFAALPIAVIGLALLVPTALAVAGTFKGTDSIGWLAICFATIGVPGVCLLVASVDIWRKGDLPRN